MERRLAAILLTDIVGYSRLIGLDEESTIARQKAHRAEIIDPNISVHGGRIVKTTGDGLLVEFASIVDAVKCAIEVQTKIARRDADVPEDRRVQYRIGVNLGDIVIDGEDILGDGVNVAARLEGLAKPGGICISETVHDQLAGKIDVAFKDAGKQSLKNVPRPVGIWHWVSDRAHYSASSTVDPLSPPDKPSIAVLPFQDTSFEPIQDHFATGISEDIITALSKYRSFFVSARNSTFTFGESPVDVKEVGRELGVRYVLKGSVRRAGVRVRVSAQLIESSNGNNIWAERYDGELADIFDLQDQITRSIVMAIMPELSDAEHARALRRPPESLDAWELYHRGMWHAHRLTEMDLSEADDLLRKSIELDPNFVAARSGLAFVVQHQTAFGWAKGKTKSWSEALRLAQDAIAIDERDALAHAVMARTLSAERKLLPAISAAQRALSHNENSSFANATAAMAMLAAGRTTEALDHIEQATRLSPRDPLRWVFYIVRGCSFAQLERYSEAEESLQSASLYENAGFWPHLHLANLYILMGQLAEAKAAIRDVLSLRRDMTISHFVRYSALLSDSSREVYVKNLKRAGLPE